MWNQLPSTTLLTDHTTASIWNRFPNPKPWSMGEYDWCSTFLSHRL